MGRVRMDGMPGYDLWLLTSISASCGAKTVLACLPSGSITAAEVVDWPLDRVWGAPLPAGHGVVSLRCPQLEPHIFLIGDMPTLTHFYNMICLLFELVVCPVGPFILPPTGMFLEVDDE